MEQSMMIETLLGSAAFILLIGFGVYLAFKSNRSANEKSAENPIASQRTRHRQHDIRVHGRTVR